MAGSLPNQRFGPESDAHSGDAKHREIVGAIPNRDDLVERDIFLTGNLPQQFGLTCAVDDRRPPLSAHRSIHDVEIIGKDIVDSQTSLQMLSEEIKSAGEDCRFV